MNERVADWEVEIKIRRNGRMVKCERATGDCAESALYAAHNDLELWTQEQAHRIGNREDRA